MDALATCPQCLQTVLAPFGVHDQATVRCPLCQATFVLAKAESVVIPVLEIVTEPSPSAADRTSGEISFDEDVILLDEESKAETAELEIPPFSRERRGPMDEGPEEPISRAAPWAEPAEAKPDFEFEIEEIKPTDEATSPFPPSPVSGDFLVGDGKDEIDQPAGGINQEGIDWEEPPVFEFDESGPAAPPEKEGEAPFSPSFDEFPLEEPPKPESPIAAFPLPPKTAALPKRPVAMKEIPFDYSSPRRRRRKESSFVGNLVGLVGGAAIGLAIGYFCLLWIGGPAKDFAKIGPMLPAWMLPEAFQHSLAARPAVPIVDLEPQEDLTGSEIAGRAELLGQPSTKSESDSTASSAVETVSPAKNEKSAAGGLELDSSSTEPSIDATATESEVETDATVTETEPETTSPIDEATPPDESAASTARDETAEPATETAAMEISFRLPWKIDQNALDQALDDAQAAADRWFEQSAELSKKERTKLKSQLFLGLYRLGQEVAPFTLSPEAAVDDQIEKASLLLERLASGDVGIASDDIGRSADKWLAYEKRGARAGIVLAGEVVGVGRAATIALADVRLAGAESTVTVLLHDPLISKGDKILVLGRIIADPSQELDGYSGSPGPAVWGGIVEKLVD